MTSESQTTIVSFPDAGRRPGRTLTAHFANDSLVLVMRAGSQIMPIELDYTSVRQMIALCQEQMP